MPNQNLGDPSFRWWWGFVEDEWDPLQKGRVRVRIHGYHSPFEKDIPTSNLPWAEVIQPATSGNSSWQSPVSISIGWWVFGFFKDGFECQQPVVLGWLPTLGSGGNKGHSKDSVGSDTLSQKDSGQETFQKNYGDRFTDPREIGDLKKYPNKELQASYPYGKGLPSEKRGVQLKEKDPKKPLEDVAIGRVLTINDPDRIQDTLIELKKKPRPDGLFDQCVTADIKVTEEEYKCGVINISSSNKGTLSGLGAPDNAFKSSMLSSEFENWKLKTENPLNAADREIWG